MKNKNWHKSTWKYIRILFILFWTHHNDPWCNMLQTLERRKKMWTENVRWTTALCETNHCNKIYNFILKQTQINIPLTKNQMLIPEGGKGGLVITCDVVKNMR